MTRRTKKILLTVAGSIAGLIVILVIAAILILQSGWFANFVKNKIVAVAEESTGGVVEIGSFQFDLWHLTVRIRDFVLHGTEPKTADPLVRVQLLEAHLKLFSGWKNIAGLSYLGIEKPEADLIVFPNGKTNIPQPKNPSKSSGNNSTLQTVIDLAVNKFELKNGLLEFAEEKASFNARGENLRVLLDYDFANPGYQGNLSISPLLLASSGKPPLHADVNIPVTLGKDAVRVTNARVTTPQSRIELTAALENVNTPVISAHLNANISLPEIQRSVNLPMDANAAGAPRVLTAELAMQMDQQSKAVHLQTAHASLGQTTVQASGSLEPGKNSAVTFKADLALRQLSRLMKVSSIQVNGDLLASGTARLDAQRNYSVNGTINSQGLALRSGTTQVSNLNLYSPFHADPYLISLDGLNLKALGGDLAAKVFVEKMQLVSLESTLRNFSLPVLAAVFTGKHLGYAGVIDGSLKARGDLKAKGATGYNAEAKLSIVPGTRGVPVSGRLNATYRGATGAVDLGQSYIAMPNTRIDLSGSLNKRIDINLVSHNLNDFLPAANFASSKPESSLPVSLRGGGTLTARAEITGNLSAPNIAGHTAITHFSIEKRPLDQFSLDLAASRTEASVQNGLVTGKGLQANFDALIGLRKWKPAPASPLKADLTVRNGDVAALLGLAGESSIPASGQLTADVHVNGTYGDPLGNATLEVLNGSAYQQPFTRLYGGMNLSHQLITITNLELDTAGGSATANGTFRHPVNSFTTGHAQLQLATQNIQLAEIKPLQERSPGAAGEIQLTASAAADLQKSGKQTNFVLDTITADLSATGLRVQNQSAGNLTGSVRTNNGAANYNLVSDFAGSNVHVNGRTSLTKNYTTTADASIRNLAIGKVLQITGQGALPVSGNLSADAHVSGTLQSPSANLSFTLAKADVYQERIDRLQGAVDYSNTRIRIPSIKLDIPAGSVTLAGAFTHPANDFNNGSLNLKLSSTDIQLAKIEHVEQAKPGFAGTLHVAADLSAGLREHNGKRQIAVSTLNADAAANGLRVDNLNLGQAAFQARTTGQNVNFRLDSDIAQSQVHASGRSQLSGDYPTRASLTFSNIRYSNIAPFLSRNTTAPPAFDALVEGQASVNGPLLDVNGLNGRLELSRLDVRTNPQSSPTGAPPIRTAELQNQGPIVIAMNQSVVRVQQLHIAGPGTNITAGGEINLKNGKNPMGLTLAANLDLGVLQDISRDFYSSGAVSMDATLHGTFSQPLINGQLVLKNANINYTKSPNGLSNANGVILLNGTNATIQTLTAESGGGKISVAGFIGYGGPVFSYNLQANANKVRVRYSGVSVTSNASIRLIGSSRRSLLRGTVTIQRITYNSSSDAGSLLSTASTPPSTPTAPSGMLAGMRLDIRILTAPDLHVSSTYTNRLEVFADMTVRGTAANPGMLGRVHVTNGQLVFFGNTYTVNTGTVNFYDPNSIEPVLDISLETITQGVDVVIGVSGTMDDLKMSYRSDPPLTFEQIVQLLATNTTPSNPVIAAHQPNPPQQSLSQMGESAVLGQAVANPLASRVQRVFGLTQFKIDPSFAGSNGQPTARVTLQQKIASNITFTYITDVSQTNSEIVRVEWDFTSRLSAVALRDFNGNVSLEFFYKFKRR